MVRNKATKEKIIPDKKTIKNEYIHAVGRRREAVARVRLYPLESKKQISLGDNILTKGSIIVNNKPIDQIFGQAWQRALYSEPFRITGTENQFVTTIKVEGGGTSGQIEAIVHGISRALDKYDSKKFRPLLKKHKLLTRDSRTRQRRMVGMGGKSRRKKQSPKR